MTSNIVNQVAYLRSSREFSKDDVGELSLQLNKTYVDVANSVNSRVIGIFSTNRPAINGKNWFFTSQKQQGLQQLYAFTTTTTIPIGFKLSSIYTMIQMYGTYKDATGNTYGLIAGTSVAIAGQISFYIAINGASTVSDSLTFVVGAGAPAIAKGAIVLEWIANT